MIDSESGFFDRSQHAMHGSGRFQSFTPGVALGRGDAVGTSRSTGSSVRCLIAHPIFCIEALVDGPLEGKVAAYPGDWDPLGEKGLEVGVRAVEQLLQVVRAMPGGTITLVPGV